MKDSYLPDKSHEMEHIPQDAENSAKSAEKTDDIQTSEPVSTEEAGMTDDKYPEEVGLKLKG